MIFKTPRTSESGLFDLKLTDKNNKSFIMTVGGNGDLYWLPENHKANRVFEFDSTDEICFSIFSQLFDAVKKRDDKYKPVLKDNKISFLSEEWHPDESNTLEIEKTENSFVVTFIKNQNEHLWTVPHRGCAICFCNSGSRVPRVESLFMQMFNYLAYHCNLIPTIEDEKPME